jgi:hypothetical protein
MAMPAHRSTSQRLHRRSMTLAVSVRLKLSRAAPGSRWDLIRLAHAKPMMRTTPDALTIASASAGRCSDTHLSTGDSWIERPEKIMGVPVFACRKAVVENHLQRAGARLLMAIASCRNVSAPRESPDFCKASASASIVSGVSG